MTTLQSRTEEQGIEIVTRILKRQGYTYIKDRHNEHCGYDLEARKPHRKAKRIEVKAGNRGQAWDYIDIRRSCAFEWSNGSTGNHIPLRDFGHRSPKVGSVFASGVPSTTRCTKSRISADGAARGLIATPGKIF